jgi:ComF family protein
VARRADALEKLINAYKFENAIAAHRFLGDLLLARLPDLPANAVIVPVPTINNHVRQRGYDHMQLIAKYVARKRGVRSSFLLRRRTTTHQRDASRADRERQAAEAYAVHGSIDPAVPYLILDDVATTGATLRYAARVLREAGAETIWMAAVARQPLD